MKKYEYKPRKIKRVKIQEKQVVKKDFQKALQYLSLLPDFTIIWDIYKYVNKTKKLIVTPIVLRKEEKKYIVGTTTDDYLFTNKKQTVDFFYDIIKKEWDNIPKDLQP